MPGSNVISEIQSYIGTVNEFSPELASILMQGQSYPEISDKVTELAKEIASIKNAKPDERQSILKRASDSIVSIVKISESVEKIKPYAKILYNGVRGVGIDLPEWK